MGSHNGGRNHTGTKLEASAHGTSVILPQASDYGVTTRDDGKRYGFGGEVVNTEVFMGKTEEALMEFFKGVDEVHVTYVDQVSLALAEGRRGGGWFLFFFFFFL